MLPLKPKVGDIIVSNSTWESFHADVPPIHVGDVLLVVGVDIRKSWSTPGQHLIEIMHRGKFRVIDVKSNCVKIVS